MRVCFTNVLIVVKITPWYGKTSFCYFVLIHFRDLCLFFKKCFEIFRKYDVHFLIDRITNFGSFLPRLTCLAKEPNIGSSMGLLPDTQNCGLYMRWECRKPSPRHRLQRLHPVSDPVIHHGPCMAHVLWCTLESLFRGGGENVPSISGACATLTFAHLVRGQSLRICFRQLTYVGQITWQMFIFVAQNITSRAPKNLSDSGQMISILININKVASNTHLLEYNPEGQPNADSIKQSI